LSLIIKLYLII